MTIKERLRVFLSSRKTAYTQVFNPADTHVQTVLKDLGKFCRANESCFHPDARAHAVAEGRREVWLRITEHMNLTPDEFWKKYGREDLP